MARGAGFSWAATLEAYPTCVDGFADAPFHGKVGVPGAECEFQHVPDFLHPALADRWYRELYSLITSHTAYLTRSLASPGDDGVPFHYRTAQFMRGPCACMYSYEGTGKHKAFPYKFGPAVGPAVLAEIEEHLLGVIGRTDLRLVPDCWVLNIYDDPSKYIPWHADDARLFDAVEGEADILPFSFG